MADDVPIRFDFDRAETRTFVVEAGGIRLDVWVAAQLEDFSRAAVQRLIQRGAVSLRRGEEVVAARPSTRLRDGDRIEVEVPVPLPPSADPEDLPLRVIAEDESMLVIDKEPGMAVHPGRGRPGGTIANAVAFRYGSDVGGDAYRPGIVHRLDLETSGVMVIAKSEAAHAALGDAFRERTVEKEYRALVFGDPAHDEEFVDLPLGRDVAHPRRQAVRFDQGRVAQTHVVVLQRFGAAAHVSCRPRTGRTHQIRVHMLSLGHPLLGDDLYAGRRTSPAGVAAPRLMLHACFLAFPHPATGERVSFTAPLPLDFQEALLALQ